MGRNWGIDGYYKIKMGDWQSNKSAYSCIPKL